MSVIDEIKSKLDIVEVISGYATLQKAGRNYKAPCPFHAEKTPSFFVFPEQQSWHCFGGCSSGGDLFTFIMKKHNLDFSQALIMLAERAGVSVDKREGVDRQEKEIFFKINELAASKYQWLLFNSGEAKKALKYLVERGVSEKSMEDFQLGFALNSWDMIQGHLRLEGFKAEDMVKAGLVKTTEGGKQYDVFRNRIIFPIKDQRGKVVGFGSRSLDDSIPKYLNSPQSPIFDKGGVLYGLDRASKAIEKNGQVIVVEGYFDVILAHQFGFQNTIASMGTALTPRQLKLLQRFTRNIILALDADAAGQKAAFMGLETAQESLDTIVTPVASPDGRIDYIDVLDAELKVMSLPEGKDPDEIIKEEPALWRELTSKALSSSEYIFKVLASGLNLDTVEGREIALRKITPLMREVKDPLRRAFYLKRLSTLLQIDINTLLKLFPSSLERLSKFPGKSFREASPIPAKRKYENYCLNLLFRFSELREASEFVREEFFQFTENRELYRIWKEMGDLEGMRFKLEPILLAHLEEVLNLSMPPIARDKVKRYFVDCALRLKQEYIKSLKVKEQILYNNIGSEEKEVWEKKFMEITKQLKVIEINEELGEVFHAQESQRRNI